jgi:putative transposase
MAISMDRLGRVLDNIFVERLWRSVNHEDVYLTGYASMAELTIGPAQYFAFYNVERPHQSRAYQTAQAVCANGQERGALIVDKYGSAASQAMKKQHEPCPKQPLEVSFSSGQAGTVKGGSASLL